ncbi:hypothetical protein QAD02_004622 [Eretmocerus hayati]|uniref:Uncharacterized protein n=1 Tax=Eretmocerus hayati TaxID=131215 RepID=A0ACC2NQ27_9HYME|nr:hypothetical protein QAD02_004622 [Eretmocerus hayati]
MVYQCIVPGCQSNKRLTKRITVFRVPVDLELREQWRKIIGLEDKGLKEPHRVCAKHFREEDVERFREYFDADGNCIHKIHLTHPRLKKGALPVITQKVPLENDGEKVNHDDHVKKPNSDDVNKGNPELNHISVKKENSDDVEEPNHGSVKKPNHSVKKSNSDDVKESNSDNVKKSNSDNVKKPNHDDVKKPNHEDLKKVDHDGKPNHDGVKKTNHEDVKKVDHDGKPNPDGVKKPSHDEKRTPSDDDDVKKPNHAEIETTPRTAVESSDCASEVSAKPAEPNQEVQIVKKLKTTHKPNILSKKNVTTDSIDYKPKAPPVRILPKGLIGGIANGFQVVPVPIQPIRVIDKIVNSSNLVPITIQPQNIVTEPKVISVPNPIIIIRNVDCPPPVKCEPSPEPQDIEMCFEPVEDIDVSDTVSDDGQKSNNSYHDFDEYDDDPPEVSEDRVQDPDLRNVLGQNSPAESPDRHSEPEREDSPVDEFEKLHQDLRKFGLPRGWYMESCLIKKYITLFEIHVKKDSSDDSNDTYPVVIKKNVVIDNTMKVSYFVLGWRVPNSETLNLPQIVHDIDGLKILMNSFMNLSLCVGVPDSYTIPPTQRDFICIDQLGCVRDKFCSLISLNKRCRACGRRLKGIHQKNRRMIKRGIQINEDDQSVDSPENDLQIWRKRVSALRVKLSRRDKKIKKLKESIRTRNSEVDSSEYVEEFLYVSSDSDPE